MLDTVRKLQWEKWHHAFRRTPDEAEAAAYRVKGMPDRERTACACAGRWSWRRRFFSRVR